MQLPDAVNKLLQARTTAGEHVSLYRYNSFANVEFLDQILKQRGTGFAEFIANKRIVDIGCGDGDVSFICEMIGAAAVFAIDLPDTNANFMNGVRALRQELHSEIHVYSGNVEDMDLSFLGRSDVIFFLGILYHLPNPIRVLRKLSVVAPHMFLSTRIFDVLPEEGDSGRSLQHRRLGYLLDPAEANNDNTNWWVMSEAGLNTMLSRSGWCIENSLRTGHPAGGAEPVHPKRDGRIFIYARSLLL